MWVTKVSRSTGKEYYFNTATGESTYEKPADYEGSGGNSGEAVQVRHILKKHNQSRRPASWRCDNITQTKEEAISQIEAIRGQVMAVFEAGGMAAGDKLFSEIASTESDCSSAQRGGDLGSFGRGKMQAAFEDASFALNVGQVSGLVDSDSGIHIILRIK